MTVIYPLGVYENMDDILLVLEEVIMVFASSMLMTKVSCMMWWEESLQKLVNVLEKKFDRGMEGVEWERELMRKTLKESKMVTKLCIAGTHSVTILLAVTGLPYFWMLRKMIFTGWYPYDETVSPYYEFTFLFTAAKTSTWFFLIVYVDAMIIAIFMQTIAQFKLLRQTITNIRQIAEDRVKARLTVQYPEVTKETCQDGFKWRKDFGNFYVRKATSDLQQPGTYLRDRFSLKEVDLEMERLMVECVNRHADLISYLQEIEMEFQPIFINQLVCNLVVIGAVSLYITFMPSWDVKSVMWTVVGIELLLKLSVICFLCDQITEQCSLVKHAIFDCDWLESTASFKQAMRIVTSRANTPVVINVAGFVPLSLRTFFYITKLAYTYYMSLSTAIAKKRS